MKKLSKKDFVEVEYTGRLKEENIVFDTTDEKTAKEADIYSEKMAYGPVIICLGQGQLVKGLEQELEGKEIGKEYTIELIPEKAFGKKDAKLIKMIPITVFKKQKIMPEQGMQVNIDGMVGMIKSAAGGRCLVDFNHPLSGKDITYTIKLNKLITDDKEKIKSFISLAFNMKDVKINVKDSKAEIITTKEFPKEIQKIVTDKLKELVPSIKEYSFKIDKVN